MRGEALMVAALLLTGCLSGGGGEDDPDSTTTPSPVSDDFDRERALTEAGMSTLAPDLQVGRAWTYEGFEFYNEDSTFTVVVADVQVDGYLFAAGAEDDLVYEALWWSRWYNKHDRDLNRVDWDRPLVKFPLYDGASWTHGDGLTLTARAAPVDTPLGKDEGFVIEGANDRVTMRVEYSPLAQNVVLLRVVTADGDVWHDLRMTGVADDQPWVWYELGELVAVPNAHEPAAFDVPDGFDHVIVSAGGTSGGRARVVSPAGPAWDTEFADAREDWRHAMIDATPGRWAAAIAGRPFVDGAPDLPADAPIGWAYMHVAPIKWIRASA